MISGAFSEVKWLKIGEKKNCFELIFYKNINIFSEYGKILARILEKKYPAHKNALSGSTLIPRHNTTQPPIQLRQGTVASSSSVTRRVFTKVNDVIFHEVWALWVME